MNHVENALEGVNVVALEQAVAAPLATRHLADLGARVIKVERPGGGDFARDYDATVMGESSYFVWLNRGKESVELDIKAADDRAVLDGLIDRADVLVQNLAPGAVARLGLDATALRSRRPGLIHCSVSGYGETGPYQHKKAYDLLVQCETGLLAITGGEAPAKVGISVADIATGMYAFAGIMTALFERERTGAGCAMEVSMIDALGEWMMQPAYYSVYGAQPLSRSGASHASIAPYGPYRAGDGETVYLGVQNNREWASLCRHVVQDSSLIDDRRFSTNSERVRHNEQLTRIIEAALAHTTADEAIELLDAAGIACAKLRSPAEFFEHPQLSARNRWREVGSPGGPVRALVPPVSVHGRQPLMGDVPALGQHNAAIRAEIAPRIAETARARLGGDLEGHQ